MSEQLETSVLTGPLIFLGLLVGEQKARKTICKGRRPLCFLKFIN